MTADQLRCAEIEYVDAIAIAGEFEVMNLPWEIPELSNAERGEADSTDSSFIDPTPDL